MDVDDVGRRDADAVEVADDEHDVTGCERRVAGHASALHAAVSQQGVGAAAAAGQYEPTGHGRDVAFVEPAGQKYPCWHGPEHAGDVCCAVDPKRPAAHGVLVGDVEPAAQ